MKTPKKKMDKQPKKLKEEKVKLIGLLGKIKRNIETIPLLFNGIYRERKREGMQNWHLYVSIHTETANGT